MCSAPSCCGVKWRPFGRTIVTQPWTRVPASWTRQRRPTPRCELIPESRARSFSGSWLSKDILAALLNGAALYPFDVKNEGVANLANWLAQQELTTCRVPVSVFRQLISTLREGENFPKLRLVHPGGEALYPTDFELYKKYFSQDCVFTSGLACTEITPIGVFLGDKNTIITGSTVPVGYPVAGVEVFLLDDAQKEVGLGEVGEIAVQSRYLAQGYWNDPDLTRIKFLPDPQGADECIYLSGDLGRMLPDGCLIHLGRKDFQVKIRGYKVILGEVEAALSNIDAITAAAVVSREDEIGNSRLVAYITAATQPAPTISELRRVLSRTLIDYMVPQIFVILDQLPLLPNRKVNRQALPAPSKNRPLLESLGLSVCSASISMQKMVCRVIASRF